MAEEQKEQPKLTGKQVDLQGLSEVWKELLGLQPDVEAIEPLVAGAIPMIKDNPWDSLQQTQGMEVVDLQKIDLAISEKDVQQVLDVIQEQPPKAKS